MYSMRPCAGRSVAGLVCESDEDMEELLARLDVEGFRLARDWQAESEAERVFEDLFRSLSALLKSPLTRSATALADALLLNLARLDVHLARINSTYLLGASQPLPLPTHPTAASTSHILRPTRSAQPPEPLHLSAFLLALNYSSSRVRVLYCCYTPSVCTAGDELSYADCQLMPKLLHVIVAAKV